MKPLSINLEPLVDFSAYGDVMALASQVALNINGGYAEKYPALTAIEAAKDGFVRQHLFKPTPRILPIPITMMERHRYGAQSFFPLMNTPWLAVVADDDNHCPVRVRAFCVPGDTGLCYRRQRWHFPLLAVNTQHFLVSDCHEKENDEFFYYAGDTIAWLMDEQGLIVDCSPTFKGSPSAMDEPTFLQQFAAVVEHSPWVAQAVWRRPGKKDTVDSLQRAFAQVILSASEDKQHTLLNAHPQLAVERLEALTSYSRDEQMNAGLTTLTSNEKEQWLTLNAAYLDKFGFPFIFAVANADKNRILFALRHRIKTACIAVERSEALYQVFRIINHRLLTLAIAS